MTPYSDSLSLGLRIELLNPATSYKSPAHSSTGTRSEKKPPPTACQLTVSCSFSLPYGGSISPFHRCTSSLSVTQEYLALRGGPRRFTRDSTCPMLLGIFQLEKVFDYWTFTIYGAGFSCFVSSFEFRSRSDLLLFVFDFGFPQPHLRKRKVV